MKNKLLALFVLIFSSNLYAIPVACPPVGSLYHGGPGTQWEVSQEFMNLGWFVSQNPDSINTALEGTSYDNPLAATISNQNAAKTYYFSCVYQIGYGKNNVTVVLVNHIPQTDPASNAGFKRMEEGLYVCETTLAHPDNCRNATLG